MAQTAKLELFVVVTGRIRHRIPSTYALRLFMGPEYNAATSLEELGSTKTDMRSKRASKRVKKCQISARQPNWSCLSL